VVVVRESRAVVAASRVAGREGHRHGQVIGARMSGSCPEPETRMKTLAIAALAPVAFAGAASAEPVTFRFETGQSGGTIMMAVFDSADSYNSGSPVAGEAIRVGRSQTEVTLDLPAGDYAMKSFHDINGDGEMNTNPFGMPTEPYAFSNNAVGNMGPASWDRAKFEVSGPTEQSISIR
jgi:uncharacterized protein (DUF2141 family)